MKNHSATKANTISSGQCQYLLGIQVQVLCNKLGIICSSLLLWLIHWLSLILTSLLPYIFIVLGIPRMLLFSMDSHCQILAVG